MRGLFVTGTDTGVGKTILSACLLAAMVAEGEWVSAYKPVITGLDEHAGPDDPATWPTDDELLSTASGMSAREVAPLRYGPAVSPHLAAELAGEHIDPEQLLRGARAAALPDAAAPSTGEGAAGSEVAGSDAPRNGRRRTLVVEGVGGLLTPLAACYSVRDLAAALKLPGVIAARPGLGTINHTLLTLEAARAAGIRVCAVVLTPWPDQPSELELSNRETIASLGSVEVAGLGPVRGLDRSDLARAGADLPWQRWLSGSSA